jgi:diaminohydroxyphosphoribosylaminopyrimidine deaminase/5-amino-6-(5-phosphoribosylamino)uracil reductase
MEEEGPLPHWRGRAASERETEVMQEERLMRQAIELAAPTAPHPNPRVGALIVDGGGMILGSGFHAGPGRPHAEVVAIGEAGAAAAGATLYVTLEPCVHTGRTPPCVEQIVAAGIRQVVVGAPDPDPRVAGGGIGMLREAGVRVRLSDDPKAAEELDPGYFHHRRTGLPRVTLKLATTLDGQTAAADGTSQWLTSEEARANAHRLRAVADGVMVGAGTVRSDAPALSVRESGFEGRQPRPVIAAGTGPLPTDAPLWSRDPIVLTPVVRGLPGEILVAPGEGGIDLASGLTALGEAGIIDLLVEGGPRIAGSLLREGLVNRGVFFLAGAFAGGRGHPAFEGVFQTVADARPLRIRDAVRIGPDLRVEFELEDV